MTVYSESGLNVDLKSFPHHRFADLPAYKKLSGKRIKEIDFCWLQQEDGEIIKTNTLIALELKGYEEHTIPIDDLFDNLVKKIRDTLSMYSMAWLNRGEGKALRNELPNEYNTHQSNRKMKFIMLVNAKNNQATQLRALKDKLKNELAGISDIYDVVITLVNLDTAIKMGLPVSKIN